MLGGEELFETGDTLAGPGNHTHRSPWWRRCGAPTRPQTCPPGRCPSGPRCGPQTGGGWDPGLARCPLRTLPCPLCPSAAQTGGSPAGCMRECGMPIVSAQRAVTPPSVLAPVPVAPSPAAGRRAVQASS